MSEFDYPATIQVLWYSEYSIDNCRAPTNAFEFLEAIQDAINVIPEEFRHSAKVSLDTESEWESSYATLEISYERPPTPEEVAERTESARKRRAQQVAHLELQLKRLGAKP